MYWLSSCVVMYRSSEHISYRNSHDPAAAVSSIASMTVGASDARGVEAAAVGDVPGGAR